MKKNVLIASFLVIGVLSACVLPRRYTQVRGSGNVVTEQRSVRDFDAVSLSGIGQLYITQGDQASLTIEAEDNLMEYLETRVSGRTLHIEIQDFVSINPRHRITYTIMVRDLGSLEVSGAGDITVSNLETDSLVVEVSGGGKIAVDSLLVQNLRVELSGAGDFDLSGQVDDQEVNLSGAGNYDAGDLLSKTTKIKISGVGNAVLWVTDALVIEMSGLGNLKYYGSPTVQQDTSGLGKVQSLGEK